MPKIISATTFQAGRLTDVSVVRDAKMEQFKRKQRIQRLLGATSAVVGLGDKPLFLVGTMGSRAHKGAAMAGMGANSSKSKPTHSPSPFDPIKTFNPVGFLDSMSISSMDAGQSSVDAYNARGYSDGTSPYASLWRTKLAGCLELYSGPQALSKSISHLQKACPLSISRLEAFCALADSAGSYSEALGRLQDVEFQREVKTVCAMLPVEQMMAKQLGPFFSSSTASLAGSSHSPSSHRVYKTIAESPMMRRLRGVYTNTPTLSESQLDFPPGFLDPLGSDSMSVDTGPSTLRATGLESRRRLPHLDMQQSSPIVQVFIYSFHLSTIYLKKKKW